MKRIACCCCCCSCCHYCCTSGRDAIARPKEPRKKFKRKKEEMKRTTTDDNGGYYFCLFCFRSGLLLLLSSFIFYFHISGQKCNNWTESRVKNALRLFSLSVSLPESPPLKTFLFGRSSRTRRRGFTSKNADPPMRLVILFSRHGKMIIKRQKEKKEKMVLKKSICWFSVVSGCRAKQNGGAKVISFTFSKNQPENKQKKI